MEKNIFLDNLRKKIFNSIACSVHTGISMSRDTTTSLFIKNAWKPSPFQPPKFERAHPNEAGDFLAAAAVAQPWYPATTESIAVPNVRKSPFIGASTQNSSLGSSLKLHHAISDVSLSGATLSSPLCSRVSTVFHRISSDAAKRRVYPLEMILSLRNDASHTPHGVLTWCEEQYASTPHLKVPSHIALSMRESLTENFFRGANGKNSKPPRTLRPGRHLASKVLSILSRLTLTKYVELRAELLGLPLRQTEDAELKEAITIFFDKAAEEPTYSKVYATLLCDLCHMESAEGKPIQGQGSKLPLGLRIRELVTKLWETRLQVRLHITDDDKVDRATGEILPAEELENKKMRMKEKIAGNLVFCGELINQDIISVGAIPFILNQIIDDNSPENLCTLEESTVDFFNSFLKTVASKFAKYDTACLASYFAVAEFMQHNHHRLRVRFMMEELEKIRITNAWPKAPFSEQQNPLPIFCYSTSVDASTGGLTPSNTLHPNVKMSSPKQSSEIRSQYSPISRNSSSRFRSSFAGSLQDVEALNEKEKDQYPPSRPSIPFNLLRHYQQQPSEYALKMFSDMKPEGQKDCIFNYLLIVLQDTSSTMAEAVDLLMEIGTKCDVPPLTLCWIMNSFMRDTIVRNYEKGTVSSLTPIFQGIRQIIIYSTQSLKQNPLINIFSINYFNLVFFTMPWMETIEPLLDIAYTSYQEALSAYRISNVIEGTNHSIKTAVLSAASLLVLRFSYVLFPKDLSKGRMEISPDYFTSLKTNFPHLANAMEIMLCELITRKPNEWEKQCVELIIRTMNAKTSTILKQAAFFTSAVDVLFTCTAVFTYGNQPILSISSVSTIISQVLSMLDDDEMFQAAVVLELLFHCNMYSQKYGIHKSSSTADLLQHYLTPLVCSEVLDKKNEILSELQSLLGGENIKSPLGVFFSSLSSKDCISLNSVTQLLADHINSTSTNSKTENQKQRAI